MISLFEAFCGLTPLEEEVLSLENNRKNEPDHPDDWITEAFLATELTVSGEDISAS